MQDALAIVKLAIDAAEKEFRDASERPLVVVRIEPLVAAPPKARPGSFSFCVRPVTRGARLQQCRTDCSQGCQCEDLPA